MQIGIPKERHAGERRVAATPEVAGQLQKLGFTVAVEAGTGAAANFGDDAYATAGATIVAGAEALWSSSDIVLKVRPPEPLTNGLASEIEYLRRGQTLISFLWPAQNPSLLDAFKERGITALAMDSIPRIS